VGTATAAGDGSLSPTSTTYKPTSAGYYWWYASYAGDTNNNAANSTCGSGMLDMYVAKASPSLSATTTGATGTVGTAIPASTVSAAISGGSSPTGTITFTVFGPQATAPTSCSGGSSGGTATVTANGSYHPSSAAFTPALPGDYWWYASYAGDANNSSASSTCGTGMAETVVTGHATPGVSVTSGSTGSGNSAILTFTVTVTGVSGTPPTGSVAWAISGYVSSCTSSTTTLNGASQATCTINPAKTSKTYSATATYAGDTNYSSGSGSDNNVSG
jgi:hypothetical protein